jgi:ATP-binding cassette, subfamily C, bacteriocin exporter
MLKRLIKFPLVRQYDRLDCGPAALLSVLRYYGGHTSLVHMREMCATDIHGTTMLDMVRAAEKVGFSARGATGSFSDLAREQMPCIAHVVLANGLEHFLVIFKIAGKRLLVGDPGKGKYYLAQKEFEEIWAQRAVILLKPNGEMMHKRNQSWLYWIWGYLRRQEPWLLQILFTGLSYTALGLLTSLFVQTLIDKLIPSSNYNHVIFIAVVMTTILCLRAGVGYLRDRFVVIANKRLSVLVTDDFISHIFRLPKHFFDSRKIGDITARINDSLRIHRTALLILQNVLLELFLVLGSMLFMFYFSSMLAWLTLTILPLYAGMLWRKSHQIKSQQLEVLKMHAVLESTYINSIQGFQEIMNFNAASAFAQLNRTVFGLFQEHIERLGFLQAGLTMALSSLSAGISVALLTLGAFKVMSGELLLGQFMAAYSLFGYILPSVANLIVGYVEFQGAQVAAQRLMDLILIDVEKNEGLKRIHNFNALQIKNLSFAYPKSLKILQDVSLTIPSGRITALWGPSGAGKSTLVQLLQRKYKSLSGEIRWDETSIEDLDLFQLREMIAVVPQQITLFNTTLAENILVGRAATNAHEIGHRLQECGLGSLMNRFENGLFTLLGEEGRKLSGGETQLLGLARALYGHPQLLIIDEGFSAIDAELEQILAPIIRNYGRTHAVLLITHNIESLLKTDYVYLLQHGRIVEEGAPEALVVNDGFFQNIWSIKNRIHLSTKASLAC